MRPDHRLARAAEQLDIAARIKPGVDQSIAHDLAVCDTQSHNETGISAKNTISDPVINAVVSRAHIIDRSNTIERLVSAVESAVRELGTALAVEQNRNRRNRTQGGVECYFAGCHDLVEHYTDDKGNTFADRRGLCPTHKVEVEQQEREEQEAERRMRIEQNRRMRRRGAA